jgi:hypothetical protein
VQEQQGYLTEQGVQVVLKPFNVVQLEQAIRAAETPPVTAREIEQEEKPAPQDEEPPVA